MRKVYFLATILLMSVPVYAAERVVPTYPPDGKIRMIIDTDAANEIDDQWALALALLSPEKFEIDGLVAAHFGDKGGPEGVQKSFDEINRVLEKAGLAGKIPVKKGSHPLQYGKTPQPSEGVDFIIERTMDASKSGPLWVIALGPATDIVCAYLKEPRLKERMIAFWHGRTQWPTKCWNFNAYNDTRAVRTLFSCDLPFVLFDTGTDLTIPMEQSEKRIRPHGPLGEYLHDIRLREKWWQAPTKGVFDLGDIAALVDPSLAKFEIVDAPSVGWDLAYDQKKTNGKIVRVISIDRNGTFDLLVKKLKGATAR
jgi:purine nucleosidase